MFGEVCRFSELITNWKNSKDTHEDGVVDSPTVRLNIFMLSLHVGRSSLRTKNYLIFPCELSVVAYI